jgi:hypothetical protein
MWVRNFLCFKVRGVPLWVIGACGLAGVLVDSDHVLAYWATGHGSRADHVPLAIIAGALICGIIACSGGLYLKLVLKKRKIKRAKGAG